MAGQSIAKLAIILTTDAAGMLLGFRKGEQGIRQFEQTTTSTFAKMATKGMFKAVASAAFDGLRRGAESLTTYEERMIAVGARLDELRKKQGTFTSESVDGTNTLSSQWKLLQQNIGDSFAGLASRFAGPLAALNSMFENTAAVVQMRALREQAEKYEKALEKAEKYFAAIKKLQDELTESAFDKRAEHTSAMAGKASGLMEKFQSPQEKFRADIAEFSDLFKQGLIGMETFERAAMDAAEGLREKERKMAEPVGAVERNTMAGFSALMAGGRAADEQKRRQLEDKQLQEQVKQTILLQRIAGTKGITFQFGRI